MHIFFSDCSAGLVHMEKVPQKESAIVTPCEALMGMDPSWWIDPELPDTDWLTKKHTQNCAAYSQSKIC